MADLVIRDAEAADAPGIAALSRQNAAVYARMAPELFRVPEYDGLIEFIAGDVEWSGSSRPIAASTEYAPSARTFMGFTGLVPSEYSSGESVHRGRITKAGNAHLRTQLIESAWAYQHRASLGTVLRRRQDGVDPATAARSWTAQQRLCAPGSPPPPTWTR
jgi:hypothetical protein